MNVELDDTEQAALVVLLRGEVENTRYPMAPRLRPLRSVLAKLGVETRRPATGSLPPPPKPPGEPSMVVARMRNPKRRRVGDGCPLSASTTASRCRRARRLQSLENQLIVKSGEQFDGQK